MLLIDYTLNPEEVSAEEMLRPKTQDERVEEARKKAIGNGLLNPGKTCCKIFWAKKAMKGGQYSPITIEYFEQTGKAKIRLIWSSYSQTSQIVPAEKLFRSSFIAGSPYDLYVKIGVAAAETTDAEVAASLYAQGESEGNSYVRR
jgi:hypothetical protein